MFYLIGIGMSSPEDITLSGLKTIKGCKKIYLEGYTSVLIDSQVEDLLLFASIITGLTDDGRLYLSH